MKDTFLTITFTALMASIAIVFAHFFAGFILGLMFLAA